MIRFNDGQIISPGFLQFAVKELHEDADSLTSFQGLSIYKQTATIIAVPNHKLIPIAVLTPVQRVQNLRRSNIDQALIHSLSLQVMRLLVFVDVNMNDAAIFHEQHINRFSWLQGHVQRFAPNQRHAVIVSFNDFAVPLVLIDQDTSAVLTQHPVIQQPGIDLFRFRNGKRLRGQQLTGSHCDQQ